MEELILLALAEIGSFIFNAILYFPWDMLMAVFEEKSRKPIYIVAIILTILVAVALAKLSVWILDEPIIPFGWARLINLCLAPFVAGYIALRMSRRRGNRGKHSNSKFHYFVAFVFTLAFVATRYVATSG
jgi:ABC-type molybdate transport system permease subunit